MASHPEWGKETTASEVALEYSDSINGKNVVITGVSPGSIGSSTALAIASQAPAHLILASRTASNLQEVAVSIKEKHPLARVSAVLLDLTSADSIRDTVGRINHLLGEKGLDVLINNAGISGSARDAITAPDGTRLDKQFFTNHLGPFLFTSLLVSELKTAAAAAGSNRGATRVVFRHAFEKSLWDESIPKPEQPSKKAQRTVLMLMGNKKFPGFVAYGQSKCANVLHATEPSRRLGRAGIIAFSVHPEGIATGIDRGLDRESIEGLQEMKPVGGLKSLDAGAATTLVATFDPALARFDVDGEAAGYLVDCQPHEDLVARW